MTDPLIAIAFAQFYLSVLGYLWLVAVPLVLIGKWIAYD